MTYKKHKTCDSWNEILQLPHLIKHNWAQQTVSATVRDCLIGEAQFPVENKWCKTRKQITQGSLVASLFVSLKLLFALILRYPQRFNIVQVAQRACRSWSWYLSSPALPQSCTWSTGTSRSFPMMKWRKSRSLKTWMMPKLWEPCCPNTKTPTTLKCWWPTLQHMFSSRHLQYLDLSSSASCLDIFTLSPWLFS